MSLRMTAEEAKRLQIVSAKNKGEKQSKYRNKKTNGYASKKEARRAIELQYKQHIGEISDLREQPVFELIPKQEGYPRATYIADFSYIENGELVVEDVKSEITRKHPVYVLKKKLLLWTKGIRIRET